jgi:hypothetical protein
MVKGYNTAYHKSSSRDKTYKHERLLRIIPKQKHSFSKIAISNQKTFLKYTDTSGYNNS